MRGAITLLPQYALWCGARLKHRDNFTFIFKSRKLVMKQIHQQIKERGRRDVKLLMCGSTALLMPWSWLGRVILESCSQVYFITSSVYGHILYDYVKLLFLLYWQYFGKAFVYGFVVLCPRCFCFSAFICKVELNLKVKVKVKLSLCFNQAPRHEGLLGE
jgi:hypothetical protein